PTLAEPQRPDTSFPPLAFIIIVVVLVIALVLYMKLMPGV
ncbi:MAG: hypothetical protein EZS28_035562, partial [Streblomastix strix]